jgi:histidyl-tRNA synthetase
MSANPKKKITAIKGTKDILPSEARKWQKVESVAREIFELYGYREIRTPVFEPTELFEKGTGETSDVVTKEMYTFLDKGGRSLTLRPEYTPSVVRAILDHSLHLQSQPMRYYFFGPMFRYDKPQKGRYRQFYQIDIEVFGEKDPAIDAEIVEMADFLLKRLNVTDTEILVNSVGCQACRPPYHNELKQAAEAERENLCADCQRKIDLNPLRIFDCKRKRAGSCLRIFRRSRIFSVWSVRNISSCLKFT